MQKLGYVLVAVLVVLVLVNISWAEDEPPKGFFIKDGDIWQLQDTGMWVLESNLSVSGYPQNTTWFDRAGQGKWVTASESEGEELLTLIINGKKTVIYETEANLVKPVWSPEGKRIAFSECVGESCKVLVWDGETVKEITEGKYPYWVDEGSILYLTDNSLVWLYSDGTANEYELSFDTRTMSAPEVREYAAIFSAFDGERHYVYFLDMLSNDGKGKLTQYREGISPHLSPEGKYLTYRSQDIRLSEKGERFRDITVVNIDAQSAYVTEAGDVDIFIWFEGDEYLQAYNPGTNKFAIIPLPITLPEEA